MVPQSPAHKKQSPLIKILTFLFLLVLAVSFFPAAGFIAYKRIQSQLEGDLNGRYKPMWFEQSFWVEDLSFEYAGKIRVDSGDVLVEYELASLFSGGGLRLRLSGSNVPIQLVTKPFGENFFQKITLEHFTADIKLSGGKVKDIYLLEAVSPELNLKLGKAASASR